MDPDEQHLLALHKELSARGVRAAVDTQGAAPRLRIYCPGELPGDGFDNNVIAAAPTGQWIFWWPWAQPIGLVTQLAQTAAAIISELGLSDDGPGHSATPATAAGPAVPAVPSLAVQRRLRQVRAAAYAPRRPVTASRPRPPPARAREHRPGELTSHAGASARRAAPPTSQPGCEP